MSDLTITSIWQNLFGFADAKAEEHYARLAGVWSRPTPLVDAILAEIQEARDAGLVWDIESHSWQRPKPTRRRAQSIAKSNGPVTAQDLVLDIFPGARVVGPEPTAEDWANIEEEASHWSHAVDGVWHCIVAINPAKICTHCKPGKIVQIIEPDGSRGLSCHYCGRRVKEKRRKRLSSKTAKTPSA